MYCSRFIPDFATLTQPLRELTKQGTVWIWSNNHQNAFDVIKAAISKDCVMAYYNPRQETQLTVDASPYGLGAILSNIDANGVVRNVAYASRSLTDTEQHYSQTEREALAQPRKPGSLYLRGLRLRPWWRLVTWDCKNLLPKGEREKWQITCFRIKTLHFVCEERDIMILCIILYNMEFSIQSSKCLLFFSLFLFAFKLQNHSVKYLINRQVKTASKIL